MNNKIATRCIFFIAGLAMAAWAVIVPFAKLNTGVNEALLGILLLCLGFGAIISMPLAGPLSSRFGCKKIITGSMFIIILPMPFLTVVNDPMMLGLLLFIFGIGVGLTDCTMNIQAIIIEKEANIPLMSGFHGMYSVGGILGALMVTCLLSVGLSIFVSIILVIVLTAILLVISFPYLLPYANPSEGPAFAIPRGQVLLLGIICFIVFLTEGTVLDWSAVYLTEVRDIAESLGGLGFAAFSIAMTIGRLSGDTIIKRYGSLRVVIYGVIIALIGFALIITSSSLYLLLMGYLLIGAGCANIVPVMFTQIGRQKSMPQMVAVPAVTTLGYIGVLAGPAMIGFIAHHSSFQYAFILVALLMVIALILNLILNRNIQQES